MRLTRYLSSLLLIISVFLGFFFAEIQSVNAEPQPVQISSFHVTTLDGKSVDNQTLMAGQAYNIKFTLEIASGINNKVVLKTELLPSGDHYWSLDSSYKGINADTWQPELSAISFDAIQGTIQLELQGSIPTNYALMTLPTGEDLHISKSISLIRLFLDSDAMLDNKTQQVIDTSIDTYESTFANSQSLLKDSKADSHYLELVKALVLSAQKEGDAGYTDRATAMLQSVSKSGLMAQQSSYVFSWVIIGILAVSTLTGFFIVYKSQRNLSFIKKKTDIQAKRLEFLASRLQGTGDTTIVGEITKVKQYLEKLSEK
jgi:hypothetical protein